MGNLLAPNALDQIKGSLGASQAQPQQQYQGGIISRMLSRGEDPSTLPKKMFLGRSPSPMWSPWDMWSPADVKEGMANSNRSLSEAMAARNTGSITPQNPTPSLPPTSFRGEGRSTPVISDIISSQPSAQPVPTGTERSLPSPQEVVSRKKKKNRPFSPYGTTPSSRMGMY